MKNRFLLFLLFISFGTFSQKLIQGTVSDKNGPLIGAAVYFNNTMVGTTTDENGAFYIKTKEGEYELIISFLGYKKKVHPLNTATYKKSLIFILEEEQVSLNEIIIKKKSFDDEWNYNFYTFKKEFIGTSKFSENCKITNPKVLYFEMNATNTVLEAYAKQPLKIVNNSLGYLIYYELVSFTVNKNMVTYAGYSRYEELEGNNRLKRKWKRNRKKAYRGSFNHFLNSLQNSTLRKDGFKVSQFRRTINKKRPSELAIREAKVLVKNNEKNIDFSKKIEFPKSKIDSALVLLKEAKSPKYKDYFYKTNLKEKDILTIKNDTTYLSFNDNLSITFKKEREEMDFVKKNRPASAWNLLPQTSYLFTIEKPVLLNSYGALKNPLLVYYEGYWAYEKFAHSLPSDYEPEK